MPQPLNPESTKLKAKLAITYLANKPQISYNTLSNKYLRLPKGIPTLPKPMSIPQGFPAGDVNIKELIHLPKSSINGKGTCAALIDSGVYNHPLLGNAVAQRISCNKNATDITDNFGHGTHLAGIIACKNALYPTMGIASGAKIVSLKVTDKYGGNATWSNVHKALMRVIDMVKSYNRSSPVPKISVVNLSFNGLDAIGPVNTCNNHRIILAIEELANLHVPVVISGGNYFDYFQTSGLGYPACSSTAIHAGAFMNFQANNLLYGRLCTFTQRRFSKFGRLSNENLTREQAHHFILAPGALSVSLGLANKEAGKYSIMSGSSIAAAVITGSILLLQQAGRNKYPTGIPVNKIKECLSKGSDIILNTPNITAATPTAALATPPNIFFDMKKYCAINVAKAISFL